MVLIFVDNNLFSKFNRPQLYPSTFGQNPNHTEGVGAHEDNDFNWLKTQDDFASVLANLNEDASPNSDFEATNASSHLRAQKQPSLRSRVLYSRFKKAKDVGSYTSEDLSCILGAVSTRPKRCTQGEDIANKNDLASRKATTVELVPDPKISETAMEGARTGAQAGQRPHTASLQQHQSPESFDAKHGLVTITRATSVLDYFSSKLAKKQAQGSTNTQGSFFQQQQQEPCNDLPVHKHAKQHRKETTSNKQLQPNELTHDGVVTEGHMAKRHKSDHAQFGESSKLATNSIDAANRKRAKKPRIKVQVEHKSEENSKKQKRKEKKQKQRQHLCKKHKEKKLKEQKGQGKLEGDAEQIKEGSGMCDQVIVLCNHELVVTESEISKEDREKMTNSKKKTKKAMKGLGITCESDSYSDSSSSVKPLPFLFNSDMMHGETTTSSSEDVTRQNRKRKGSKKDKIRTKQSTKEANGKSNQLEVEKKKKQESKKRTKQK